MSVCVLPNSSKTTGAIGLQFGVKMHITPVNVVIYIHDLNFKVKVTARSKIKFTFIAISQSILKLQLKCKNWQIAYVFGYLNKTLPKLPHFRFENSPGTQNFDSVNSVRGYPCDIS